MSILLHYKTNYPEKLKVPTYQNNENNVLTYIVCIVYIKVKRIENNGNYQFNHNKLSFSIH